MLPHQQSAPSKKLPHRHRTPSTRFRALRCSEAVLNGWRAEQQKIMQKVFGLDFAFHV